jgi:hypothetical protein
MSPDRLQKSQNHTTEPASPFSPTKRTSARPENSHIKAEIPSRSSSEKDAIIDQLKEHLIALARTFIFPLKASSRLSRPSYLLDVAGVKLSTHQLAWKTLVKQFADKGFVLCNYPEGVAFPCDDTRGKGINGVPVKEQALLLDAFNHPTHPIKLVHTYDSGGA